MAFYGRSFIWDGTPSELFGLYIDSIDSDAVNASMGSSSMEIVEKKIFRRPAPYFLGATPSPKLEFEMSAFSENEIDSSAFEEIQKFLFSSRSYKRLQIDQPDMQNIYFNCILNDPKIQRVGNLIFGVSFTVTCDSPYAYKFPLVTTYNYSSSVVDSTELFYNMSDDDGSYLLPNEIIITVNNEGGNVSVTNLDDENRVMSFTGLQANEVLTVSSLYQTIDSSSGLKRMGNFNKKFLRLVPNRNRLRIQGNLSSFVMTNTFIAKKIGG